MAANGVAYMAQPLAYSNGQSARNVYRPAMQVSQSGPTYAVTSSPTGKLAVYDPEWHGNAQKASKAARERIAKTQQAVQDLASSDDDDDDGVKYPAGRAENLSKLQSMFIPVLLSTLLEVAFISGMLTWGHGKWHGSPLKQVDSMALLFDDEGHMAWEFWTVFGVCLLGRIAVCIAWNLDVRGARTGRFYGATFMFFSVIQWLFYLTAYYWIYDHLTEVVKAYSAAVDTHVAADGGEIFNSAYQACLTTNGNNKTLCGNVMGGTCKKEYVEGAENCLGEVLVAGTHCCISLHMSLSVPGVAIDPMGHTMDVSIFFMLLQWLAVLALTWVLLDNPLLAKNSAYSAFSKGVFLDILDCVVFSSYITNKLVRFPAYGISPGGEPMKEDPFMMLMLWRTWVAAFSTAIITPVIYTFLMPRALVKVKAEVDQKMEPLTLEKATEQLLINLRKLDREKAMMTLDSALELQKKKYAAAGDKPQPVVVLPKEEEDDDRFFEAFTDRLQDDFRIAEEGRCGTAQWVKGLTYDVEYDDGSSEQVNVRRLEPDMSSHASLFAPGCVEGWCQCSSLSPDDVIEKFDKRAEVLDALRSVIFLEVPFLLWRLWFEWGSLTMTSSVIVYILKNLCWTIYDLMVIFSCSSDDAVLFSSNPIKGFKAFMNTLGLNSIFVGPAGVFALMSKVSNKAVKDSQQAQRERIAMFRTWLMVEKEKVDANNNESASKEMEEEIGKYTLKLKRLDEEIMMW
eukprot:TRINITY_DN93862_c0_g1_i1.p1 TRINITY_DN93862_c0_g1~~TRINITY_DN93862_c0_g1_i1.p1  ORF type:complete len:737 (-),score=163.93 TRINITY_DN93862_c0_g1_i1:200-2410(-)